MKRLGFFDQSGFKEMLDQIRANDADLTIVCCTELTIVQLRQLANALYHNDTVIKVGGRALYSAYAYNSADWDEADNLLAAIHNIVDQNYLAAHVERLYRDQSSPAEKPNN